MGQGAGGGGRAELGLGVPGAPLRGGRRKGKNWVIGCRSIGRFFIQWIILLKQHILSVPQCLQRSGWLNEFLFKTVNL
jgi:hypothetical protein